MSCLICHCRTCNSAKSQETYSDIVSLLEYYKKEHEGHDYYYTFSDKIPLKYHSRSMIRYISWHHLREPLVGVEIGVREGYHAFSILNMLNIKQLYLIDPYEIYDGYDGKEYDNRVIKDVYKEMRELLKPYEDKTTFICDYSYNSTNRVPDNLDFVYIDGNHSYEYVLKDLEMYYPKIKIGGIIGGHDFSLNTLDIPRAVCEFIHKHNLKRTNSEYLDYWIVKDKEI